MSKYKVVTDQDLADLIPAYLDRRKEEVRVLFQALDAGDFPQVLKIAHKLKGTGAGYGFDPLTEYADKLYDAANAKNIDTCRTLVSQISDYVENVEVRYQ